jgi:hypothetical protein
MHIIRKIILPSWEATGKFLREITIIDPFLLKKHKNCPFLQKMQKINLTKLGSYWENRSAHDPIFVSQLFRYDKTRSEGTATIEYIPIDLLKRNACLND